MKKANIQQAVACTLGFVLLAAAPARAEEATLEVSRNGGQVTIEIQSSFSGSFQDVTEAEGESAAELRRFFRLVAGGEEKSFKVTMTNGLTLSNDLIQLSDSLQVGLTPAFGGRFSKLQIASNGNVPPAINVEPRKLTVTLSGSRDAPSALPDLFPFEIPVPAGHIELICDELVAAFPNTLERLGTSPVFREIVPGQTREVPEIEDSTGRKLIEAIDRNVEQLQEDRHQAEMKEETTVKAGIPNPTVLSPKFTDVAITTPDMKQAAGSHGWSKVILLLQRDDLQKIKPLVKAVVTACSSSAKSVRLNVWICELREGAIRDLGLRLGSFAGPAGEESFIDGLSAAFDEQPVGGTPGTFEAFSLGDFRRGSGFELSAMLNTLESENKAKILAHPTLSTSDGVTTSYNALERIPYLASFTVQANTPPVGGVGYFDVGLSLYFEPSIEGDIVNLKILPVVSSLVAMPEVAPGIRAPQTSHRQLHGEIRIQNRHIVCLSSLITEEERTTVHKVPLLGDIPALGKLFREKRKDRERTEILIFVQPEILEIGELQTGLRCDCIPDAIGSVR